MITSHKWHWQASLNPISLLKKKKKACITALRCKLFSLWRRMPWWKQEEFRSNVEDMWRQSWQPDSGPVDLLTIEGLGADLAVRPGYAAAMTRRGGQVTMHPPHRRWTSGKLLAPRKASQDKTERPFPLIKIHTCGCEIFQEHWQPGGFKSVI